MSTHGAKGLLLPDPNPSGAEKKTGAYVSYAVERIVVRVRLLTHKRLCERRVVRDERRVVRDERRVVRDERRVVRDERLAVRDERLAVRIRFCARLALRRQLFFEAINFFLVRGHKSHGRLVRARQALQLTEQQLLQIAVHFIKREELGLFFFVLK
jgi:hypothetical protein